MSGEPVRRPYPAARPSRQPNGHRDPRSVVLLYAQALVLGLLQGLTEFLPVSSSGHLQAVPFLLGWDSGPLSFDVLVHAGTLVAVVWYFREDLLRLTTASIGRGGASAEEQQQSRRMVLFLAIGTVPAAASGYLFEDVFTAAFGSPIAIGAFMYVTALLLWGSERIRARRIAAGVVEVRTPHIEDSPEAELLDDPGRSERTMRTRDAVAIGLTQAFAIFPGISRSGATIATGMALGFSRAAAARFSFLLSIPIILGATAYQLTELGTIETGSLPFALPHMAVGVLAAAGSGYWAIRFLLQLVQRRDLLGFARYMVAFGSLLIVLGLVR